jgi:hypothetical protein
MPTQFCLAIFFEQDHDERFAYEESDKLLRLVEELAPHIALNVEVFQASRILRARFSYGGRDYNVPNHEPVWRGGQTLLITNEEIGAEGWAGREMGCLSKRMMQLKAKRGQSSADITIHEWLHTIEGRTIDGRQVPHPHSAKSYGISKDTAVSYDRWYSWYRFMLRET